LGGASGQAADIEIQAREVLRIRDTLNRLYQKHTGQTLEKIEQETERDLYMDGNEAVKWGLIDYVISARGENASKEIAS
jgi:ATP-dependent Clp protease protease subunit